MSDDKVNNLIRLTIKNQDKYPYINLDKNNKYRGWVADFNLRYTNDKSNISLDLTQEFDLFLLFVLASAWSKSAPWENAVFFTTYVKHKNLGVKQWCDEKFVAQEITNKSVSCKDIQKIVSGINSRRKISFRKDLYASVNILAKSWDDIKQHLQSADNEHDWKSFIDYIGSIAGLGANGNKMRIKIPLILRELRCQNIYPGIDGKYCCVADARVRWAYIKYIGRKLPVNYLKASEVIWNDFGTLYDIPPFACKDFGLIQE